VAIRGFIMANIFTDTFEANNFDLWTSNNHVSIETDVSGMDAGKSLAFIDEANADCQVVKTLASSVSEIWVAFDFMPANIEYSYGSILAFMLGGLAGSHLIQLHAEGDELGQPVYLALWGGSGDLWTIEGNYVDGLTPGTKYRIQVHFKPDGANGIFQVMVDGILVIDYAGPIASGHQISETTLDTVVFGWTIPGYGSTAWQDIDNILFDDAEWPDGEGAEVLAIVGSVGIKVGVTGAITPLVIPGAEEGVVGSVAIVVGSVAIGVSPVGIINSAMPPTFLVVGSVGIKVSLVGVISTLAPVINATIGSVKLGIGVRGVAGGALPVAPPVLAIIGSVGIGINATGEVGGVVLSTLAVIGSVEIRIGEFRVPELTVVHLISPADTALAITGSVGMEVGPAGVIALSAPPPVYAVPPLRAIEGATINIRVAGVIAFISPQILEVIGDIEVEVGVGGGAVDPGVFDTYALTGIRGEPSIYSGWNFNSFAQYRGQYFGAGMDGVYLLEGEDDDGEAIHAGIKLGPYNFSTDREKRLRLLRLGGKTDGAQVKVSNGNGSAGYYDVVDGRAGVSREVQGREITIDISDFETLDHLELVPLILAKR
jgi:hypothetical protein